MQPPNDLLLLLAAQPPVGVPLTPYFILQEDGTDYILQEDGTSLIMIEGT